MKPYPFARLPLAPVALLVLVARAGAVPTPPACVPPGAAAVLRADAGLHLHARLEEASGPRADVSGRGNHLAPTNAPAASADRREGTASVVLSAGAMQYLQRASVDLAAGFPGNAGSPPSDLTVALWLKATGGGNVPLVLKVGDTGQRSWSLWLWDFPDVGLVVDPNVWDENAQPSPHGDFHGTTVIALDRWYHVVWTYAAATGTSRVYVDGAQDAAPFVEFTGGAAFQQSTAPLTLGHRPGQPAYADALLDEVLVLDRTLGADEVASLYQWGVVDPALLSDCDDGEPCTDDACAAGGTCQHAPNDDPCDDGDACTTADACSGGGCAGGPPPACDDGDPCTADACDPGSGCVHPPGNAGTPCRPAAGVCDVAEACDGVAPGCPPDALVPAGTPCRAAAGACDVAETCSGAAAACPADAAAAAGAACATDDAACTDQACTATGACVIVHDRAGSACDSGLPGACALGALVCDPAPRCAAVVVPGGEEHCHDGVDDDCDGAVDEADCVPGCAAADTLASPTQTARTRVRLVSAAGGDRLLTSGTIVLPAAGFDPAGVPLTLAVGDVSGTYHTLTLPAGSLAAARNGRRFAWVDRARPFARGGLREARFVVRRGGTVVRYRFLVEGVDLRTFVAGTGSVTVQLGARCFLDPADACTVAAGGATVRCD